MSRTLYIREAAQELGITQKALRARVARQTVPFRRWGGRIIFLTPELREYLEKLPGCRIDEALRNNRMRRGDR